MAKLPETTGVAVWLVIDGAALWDGFQTVGPVWLYYHTLWPDQVRTGASIAENGVEHPAPEELDDWDAAKKVFEDLEEVEHRVFARVWIDASIPSDARRRARTVVQDLIDLAKQDSAWVCWMESFPGQQIVAGPARGSRKPPLPGPCTCRTRCTRAPRKPQGVRRRVRAALAERGGARHRCR